LWLRKRWREFIRCCGIEFFERVAGHMMESDKARVRVCTEADVEKLKRLHAESGFAYAFPNLSDPLFVSKLVLEDAAGGVKMAAMARLTCEMYLLVSREERDARGRWRDLLALHAAGAADLSAKGLEDAHAWLPPAIAKRFGRRLETLGWVRDDAWTPYCRRLRE
jgi:hypothetical protein